MHYVQKKNNLFSARLRGISANSHEYYRRYNFQLLLKFPEISVILNFRKIYNPTCNTVTTRL